MGPFRIVPPRGKQETGSSLLAILTLPPRAGKAAGEAGCSAYFDPPQEIRWLAYSMWRPGLLLRSAQTTSAIPPPQALPDTLINSCSLNAEH